MTTPVSCFLGCLEEDRRVRWALERTLIPLLKSWGLVEQTSESRCRQMAEQRDGRCKRGGGGELTGREPSPRLQCAGMVYEHLAYTGDSGSRNAKSEMSRNKAKEDCRMSPSSREPPTLPSATDHRQTLDDWQRGLIRGAIS